MEPTLCPPSEPGPYTPASVLSGRSGTRYTVGPAPIGAGAQAEVWPALRDDGLHVAIKLARPARAAIEALDSEGRYLEALARGGTVCTVPCIDHVEWDGRPGLVLPRLPRDVNDLVRTRIAADPDRAIEAVLDVGVQLARALAALHLAEVARPGEPGRLVHRDVKPDNVLVDATGAVRLADLGGSLLADGLATRELGVFGSPLWAPPDQMLPGLAEPNSTWDTYAACVMVFSWISEARPSFQVDPSKRLRPRGREILARMNEMATARPAERGAAIEALFEVRDGAGLADVIDPSATSRFDAGDRERIVRGVARLASTEVYGDLALQNAAEELVAVLERGLSPHAAPSPPHRYWRAAELADELAGIARRLGTARRRMTAPEAPLPVRIERTVSDPEGGNRRVVLPELGSLIETAPPWQAREARLRAGSPPALPRRPGASSLWFAPTIVLLAVFAVWPNNAPLPTMEGASTTVRVDGTPTVPAFRIARTEVSNRAYASCVAAGACTPVAWDTPGSPWQLGVGAKGAAFSLLVGDRQPVVGVTWDQARAWCTWAGGTLPTEAQWVRAALGTSDADVPWPWGEEPPDCARANLGACGLGLTVAVDSLLSGASHWGAVHLVGNAWEWTASKARSGAGRVLVGGAFDTSSTDLGGAGRRGTVSEASRRIDVPGRVSPTYSFRCAFPEGTGPEGAAGSE